MHGIVVDNDGFPLPLTSLEWQGHSERARRRVGEMDVGRGEKGERIVVM